MTAAANLKQHLPMATKKSSKPSKAKPKPNVSPFAAELSVLITAMADLVKRQKLAQLTPEQVKYTVGRIPSAELPSLDTVVALMDERPEIFVVFANKDRGTDDRALETGPTREALGRYRELAPLLATLQTVHDQLEHEVLAQGTRVREVTSPVYQLAKALSRADDDVANTLGPVFTYYGGPSRKGKAKRRGK